MTDHNANPTPGDFRRAGALLAGWATGDINGAMHTAIIEARDVGRSFHLIAAMAETCTRVLNLRDPERLDALRADIAKYQQREDDDQ